MVYELIEIFLDEHEKYLNDKIVAEKDEIEQGVIYGQLTEINALRSLINYLKEEEI